MDYSFTFDPRKKGLRQVLGDLEADIMELVWEMGDVTVRQIYETLNGRRTIAYTTVMTVMSRLAEKGILQKIKSGTAHHYRPAVSRRDFTQSTVTRVMDKLLEDFTAPAINRFVDYLNSENPEKIEELARLIEEKRRKKNA